MIKQPELWIRIHWIRIRIRIQSGSRVLMTKNWRKKYSRNFFSLFFIQNSHLLMSKLHVQEKPSAFKREHPALQKMKFINFHYVCGSFLPSWILIWIKSPFWTRIQSGYGSGSTALTVGTGTYHLVWFMIEAEGHIYTCVASAIFIVFLPVWQLTINISWRHEIGHSLVQGYFIVTTFKILMRKCSVYSLGLLTTVPYAETWAPISGYPSLLNYKSNF